MNERQIIIEIDPRLKNAARELAQEFNVSLKEIFKRALIDILKKHQKEVPVKEL